MLFSEVELRTQGSRPRPRTQKNPRPRTAFPRTDTLEAKDRNARGQGPRTQAQVFSKKKKKRSSQKFFKRSPQKNVFQEIFQALHKILTIQKIALSSNQRPIFEDLRPRGQGQGLDLRGQGQGLQNLSSRPRTSSRTPPLLFMKTPNVNAMRETESWICHQLCSGFFCLLCNGLLC